MFAGACLYLMLCNANRVILEDNTKVIVMKNPSWSSELVGLWETLFQEPWILLLFPMFFASNFFYTYQKNVMNAAHFNTRTRALNNLLYWLAQIFGAVLMGYCLDIHSIRRSVRARIAFGFLATLTFVIWGAGWYWQKQQAPREVAESKNYEHVDWTEGGRRFIGPMFLYFFYGFFDAIWQTSIYWCVRLFASPRRLPVVLARLLGGVTLMGGGCRFMGSLSNSGRRAANLAGESGKRPLPWARALASARYRAQRL